MTIAEVKEADSLRLDVEGKIDTLSSQEFQNYVLKAFQRTKTLVINMENVTYVSSAGLRALILGQKTALSKGGSLCVINVPTVVQDVFRVTGFDKVLNIR